MIYKQVVCDCETTGTDPEKHDIIEVCFWRIEDDISKTWWIKPLRPENIDDEALKVNNHKREDILHLTKEGREKYKEASVVIKEIEIWFMSDGAASEDRVFIGQNPSFDYNFLLKLWKLAGNEDNFPFGYWINKNNGKFNQGMLIDTIQIARFIDIANDKRRDRYGLGSLVKSFGITKATAHRADGDVKMTRDLYLKMMETFKKTINEDFSDTYK